MKEFDVAIVGGGPGGYGAAVRASQVGLKVALVEKEHLGGTCLNWGCIPTKSLLQNAEVIHLLSKGGSFGFAFNDLSVAYSDAQRRSRSVVTRQARRINLLMKNSHVEVYNGTGKLGNPGEIEIEPSGEIIRAKEIILATGATPRALPGIPFDGDRVINYRRALELTEVPASVLIVGAGPIGMEFATIWSRYGAKVIVVEVMPHVFPLEDEEICIEAERQFRRLGITVKAGAKVEGILLRKDEAEITVSKGDQREIIPAEKVLVSIGFTPASMGLGLERLGVATTGGCIVIDPQMRTSVPHIYAIGDVTGKLGLAHVASAQGIIAAESIAGIKTEPLEYNIIPRCIYAHPEVASVGLTEAQAREQGHDVATGQSAFVANGKALALDENFGFAKIVGEKKTNKLLGVHLIGAHVTELIAGPAALLRQGATAEDLARTVHPHPSLSEALMEAAQALMGHAVYV